MNLVTDQISWVLELGRFTTACTMVRSSLPATCNFVYVFNGRSVMQSHLHNVQPPHNPTRVLTYALSDSSQKVCQPAGVSELPKSQWVCHYAALHALSCSQSFSACNLPPAPGSSLQQVCLSRVRMGPGDDQWSCWT